MREPAPVPLSHASWRVSGLARLEVKRVWRLASLSNATSLFEPKRPSPLTDGRFTESW